MKGLRLSVSVLFCLAGSMVMGQQNFFNVPSSDITLKAKPFFQQQFNISKGLVQLNSTFCWGLGHEAEVGVNVLGLNLTTNGPISIETNGDTTNPPVYPFFTFNFQKAFTLSPVFKVSVGTQTGFSNDFHFGMYNYGNLVTVLRVTHSKIVTGVYQSSNNFLGAGARTNLFPNGELGLQVGLEQEIIEDWLTLIAENITGKHNLGETTMGAACYILPHWALSAGYQFANPGSTTINAMVVEITYVPSAHLHKKIFRQGHQHKA